MKDSTLIYTSEISDQNREMELEDLFPEEFYVKYVNETYKKELGDNPVPVPIPGSHPLIRRRLDDFFKSKELTFHKTRPARKMLEDFGKLTTADLPPELVKNMEKLFELINSRMPN